MPRLSILLPPKTLGSRALRIYRDHNFAAANSVFDDNYVEDTVPWYQLCTYIYLKVAAYLLCMS